jgi:hypothetical protein
MLRSSTYSIHTSHAAATMECMAQGTKGAPRSEPRPECSQRRARGAVPLVGIIFGPGTTNACDRNLIPTGTPEHGQSQAKVQRGRGKVIHVNTIRRVPLQYLDLLRNELKFGNKSRGIVLPRLASVYMGAAISSLS